MSHKLIKSTEKKKLQKVNSAEIVAKSVIEYVVAVWGIALCVFVPLYLKNGYYSVGTAKYEVYKNIFVIGLIALVILSAVWLMMKERFTKPEMTVTDRCVCAFLIESVIAAVVGGNFKECLNGYNGWYMGLFALFSFGVLYYFFSRFGQHSKWVLIFLCIASMIAYVIGILHRLLIDVIGTYEGIADVYKTQFLSTLGQATWYSSFVCTVFPLGVALFWCAKKTWQRIVSGIFVLAGFCTIFTQNSDSAYIALAGFMLVFFWFSACSAVRMERFVEIVLLLLLATRLMNLAFRIYPNPILIFDTYSKLMLFHPMMWGVFVLALVLWAVSLLCAKKKIDFSKGGKVLRAVILGGVIAVVFSIILILVLGYYEKLPGAIRAVTDSVPYLIWKDSWGNGRGGTWSISWQMFWDMDVVHKLFGVGPDGYAPYAYSFYQERLGQLWGERTLTNAHNEWPNAAINYGIIGASAYIGIFITAIRQFVKNWSENPMLIGFAACVVSYMCHNFFCYQQVCCTPFMFIIIGAGIYITRKKGA